MFLLLLLAYLAHNATQAFTLPLERQSQSEALFPRLGDQYFDDRSVWSIIWSCLVEVELSLVVERTVYYECMYL